MNIMLGVTFGWISETSVWVTTGKSSNMREPAAEDNPAFEGTATTPGLLPKALGIQSKLAKKGFGEGRASELTESMLRYNRRDQHLAHVSCPYLKSLRICCALPSFKSIKN